MSKTYGLNDLQASQVEDYLDAAAKEGFDCVITISNQIMKIRVEHPVSVDKKKLKKVSLEHLSWSRILTAAVKYKSGHKVADPEQAWILGELIRYLEHRNTGAVDFNDMGSHWVDVRDGVKHGTLRQTDQHAFEVAGKWEELLSFAVLRLGRELGVDVEQVWSRSEQGNLSQRIDNIVQDMVKDSILPGKIRIPDAVGDIDIKVDLRAQQVEASMKINAPKEGDSKRRINWILRQLKASSSDVRLESWGVRARSSQSDLLSKVRDEPERIIPPENREISYFTESINVPMGPNRKIGRNSFIQSVLDAVDHLYRNVVQNLRNWQPSAPKLNEAKKDVNQKPIQQTVEEIISETVAESPEGSTATADKHSAQVGLTNQPDSEDA